MYVLDVRSSPAIYSLPVISDNAKIAVFGSEFVDYPVLRLVGILILIDKEI